MLAKHWQVEVCSTGRPREQSPGFEGNAGGTLDRRKPKGKEISIAKVSQRWKVIEVTPIFHDTSGIFNLQSGDIAQKVIWK